MNTYTSNLLSKSLSIYSRLRRLHYRDLAYEALGAKCASCGTDASPQNEPRLAFLDKSDPLKARYRTNPSTLHRRLCREPQLRDRVTLLCHLCRLGSQLEARIIEEIPK